MSSEVKRKELPQRPYYNVFDKAMPLEDALDDSPMFRKKLKEAELEVDEFSSGIKRIIKASKHYQVAAEAYADTFKEFIDEVGNFKDTTVGVSDDILDKGFSKNIGYLKDIASFFDFLVLQMEGLVSGPLQEFVTTDVKSVKESAKRYEKATSALDASVSRLGQVKKKNSDKLSELSAENRRSKEST
eukprot:TRINITY_DN8102_c0_g1_i1.p1 TRINITY_DN8102_c0_g1~~TRINITY_DN8102_c0_g1_i1.p1  ORF type:complete len:187 (+),score=31.85 TRINITY_DN8102_c0_g1_i1:122-682(+)